ncbi:hypothetical protein ScPMuIL_000156 [Solemya velum]
MACVSDGVVNIISTNTFLALFLAFWFVTEHGSSGDSATALFCWTGSYEAPNHRMNQSCATGDVSLGNVVSLRNASSNQTFSNNSMESDTEGVSNNTAVTRCMMFLYMERAETKLTFTRDNAVGNFSCDFEGICQQQTGMRSQVNYHGVNGSLYCCNTSNCNDVDRPDLPLPGVTQFCYDAFKDNNTSTGKVVPCGDQNSWCMKTEFHGEHGTVQHYQCDTASICGSTNMTFNFNTTTCKSFNITQKPNQFSTDTGELELCCCKGQKCLKPDFPITDLSTKQPGEIPSPQHGETVNWLLYGLLTALVILLVVVVVVLVVIAKRCNRNRKTDDRVQLTYQKLNASDNQEDIQMLLG